MNSASWFDDIPVIGKLPPEQAIEKLREVGENDVADMLEMTQEAETKSFGIGGPRSWVHLQDKTWEHIAPFSELALAIAKTIAKRHRNVPVQDCSLGLDFSMIPMNGRLAEGSYLAVQIPENQQVRWNWQDWVFHPGMGQVVKRSDPQQLIPYNYLIFSISRYEGK